MADKFKNGILYMDDIDNVDLFEDILNDKKESEEERKKREKEEFIDNKTIECKSKIDNAMFDAMQKLVQENYDINTFYVDENMRIRFNENCFIDIIPASDGSLELEISTNIEDSSYLDLDKIRCNLMNILNGKITKSNFDGNSGMNEGTVRGAVTAAVNTLSASADASEGIEI